MRLQFSLWRLAMASVGLLVLAVTASAQTTSEVRLADDSVFATNGVPVPSPPDLVGHLPVLFVHGHNTDDAHDSDFNYRKNWQDSNRPSFKQTLDLNAELGIEPYYIRFIEQGRSITQDAREIGEAIELILHRHDPSYPAHPTSVQVVIIAYSKGTISSRLYLKTQHAAHPDVHPVSEFIAISPPNHGISVRIATTCSGQQLMDGRRDDCGTFITHPCNPESSLDFITNLNQPDEAPGSRAAGAATAPNSPTTGTLYVTIFADHNRDFVGGDTASSDTCGRRLAKNLSPNAVKITLGAAITDDGWVAIHHPLYNPAFPSIDFTDDEKKAFAVHQNTVHTPEVICQALYAAAYHRSPEGHACTPGANGLPIIPPPGRAAAMLTLDFSSSMSWPACTTCGNTTRAEVLQDAVEIFVKLWSAVSVPSDRIGVTYFRTNVDPPAGGTLALLSTPGADDILIGNVNGQRARGSTAMGGGLQRAIEVLRDPSVDAAIRRVILFTDGMQNVNPMVVSVGAHHEIINQGGRRRRNSNVTPTGIRLDQLGDPHNGGIAVDTIGIGEDAAFVGLLSDIATETGGRTLVTSAPNDDLRHLFIEQLINALRGFSPQLVAYRNGAIGSNGSTEAFAIENGARKLVLKLSWKRGDTMDFSVIKDGVDVTSGGRFIDGAFYKIFVINLPKGRIGSRGNWELRIKGKASTPYEAAAITDGEAIAYDASFDTRPTSVGDLLNLVVRLKVRGQPISDNARVTVILKSPKVAVRNLIANIRPKESTAFESGMTLTERKLLTLTQDPKMSAMLKPKQETLVLRPGKKGEFRTRLRPRIPGVYTALVTIEGEDDKIGRFSRTMMVTTVVRSEKSTPKK